MADQPNEPILQFFRYDHLPARLQKVSKPFGDLASDLMLLPRNPERSVALRKLLEAKDAAVRAELFSDETKPLITEAPAGTFNCPRRIEDGRGPGSPFATPGATLLDRWREGDTCSYCGSMKPETVLAKAEQGVELTPTDKSYKLYVDGPGKFYFQHFTKEQCIAFVDLLNAKKLNLAYPGHFYVKPFFIE